MIIDSMKKWKTKFFISALLLCVGLAATVSYALTEDEENNIDVYQKAAKGG